MIKTEAILKNGKIYIGDSHGKMQKDKSRPKGYLNDGTLGYITDTGEFVNRIKAAKIAFDCGQIHEPIGILLSIDDISPRLRKKFKGLDDTEIFS